MNRNASAVATERGYVAIKRRIVNSAAIGSPTRSYHLAVLSNLAALDSSMRDNSASAPTFCASTGHAIKVECRIQGGKTQWTPIDQGKTRQVVAGRRKVFCFFKFRHELESAVQRKAPPMVPADQFLHFCTARHQQVTPVGANIGKAVGFTAFVLAHKQGRGNKAVQQSERDDTFGLGGDILRWYQLPGPVEYFRFHGFEYFFLPVKRSR
jgi:hypothetical protein